MAQIEGIEAAFQTIVNASTTIKSFHFDHLSIVNQNRDKTYPLLLVKLPNESNVDKYTDKWEHYNLIYYTLDVYHQGDARKLSVVSDSMKNIAHEVMDLLTADSNKFRLKGGVKYNYGYEDHVDQLVGTSATFVLSVFHCRSSSSGSASSSK